MSKLTLSIIIVSYNTAELTLKAVQTAWHDIQQSDLLRGNAEIIVVDNASTDNSVAVLQQLLESREEEIAFTVLAQDDNKGFAGANNIGIEASTGEYTLLLNSDTEVQKGALSHMIETFRQFDPDNPQAQLSSHHGELDRLGFLAARLLNPDGSYQAQGGDLPTLISVASQFLFLDDIPVLSHILPSTQHTGAHARHNNQGLEQKGWVAGTAMMFPRQLVAEIGSLDENIFMYGEDMEWCLRAQNHLWDVAIDHEAQIMHHGSASSSSTSAITGEIRGLRYIWAKHKPHWQRTILRSILVLGCVLRLAMFGTIARDETRVAAYQNSLRRLLQQPI